MASTNDYMDRLRSIRDKYGVSQTKNYPEHQLKTSDHQQVLDRNTGNSYLKSELYGIETRKFTDLNMSPSSIIQPSRTDYGARPLSSLGLPTQDYSGVNDYSRRVDREREIDQLRDTFVASRKKVTEDLSTKSYSRNFSKDVPRSRPSDFIRETRETREMRETDLKRDYSRGKEDFRNPEILGGNRYSNNRSTLIEKADEYVSPIKRMTEEEEKKSYRKREFENPSDTFWRGREAKLAELTSNKLNESQRISLFKDQRSSDYKPSIIKKAELYTEPHMKSYSDFHVSSKMDFENRPSDYSVSTKQNEYPISAKHTDYSISGKPSEYSVSNIDRIQQRIQSILGKR